jgi:hypothetical protein
MSNSSMNFPFYVLPEMMVGGNGDVGSYETRLAAPLKQLGNFPFSTTRTKLLYGASMPFGGGGGGGVKIGVE